MAATTFDTLKYANTLKSVGVPDKLAEAQASVLGEALAINFKDLATKDDLAAIVGELSAKSDGQEQRLNAKSESLEQRLNAKIDNLAAKIEGQLTLVKWMIGLAVSLNVAVLIRLFFVRAL